MKIILVALLFIFAVACTEAPAPLPPAPSSTVVTKIDLPLTFAGFLEGSVGQLWLKPLVIECEAPCNRNQIYSLKATSSAKEVLTAALLGRDYVTLTGVSVGSSEVTVCSDKICSSQIFTVVAAPITPPSPPSPPPPPPPPPTGPGFISGVTCSYFSRWSAAQNYYITWRNSQAAARALDGDGDGIACENLPGAP